MKHGGLLEMFGIVVLATLIVFGTSRFLFYVGEVFSRPSVPEATK